MAKLPPVSPPRAVVAILLVLGAVACFHAAYSFHCGFLIAGYVACLVQLARLRPMRVAFYAGVITGLFCFAPQLAFFWGIFGTPAIALWFILAFWIALFVALTHASFMRLGAMGTLFLAPFLWTGLEYFRSELYYLRFSWLNVGYALGDYTSLISFNRAGIYGIGFIAVFLVTWPMAARLRWVIPGSLLILFVFVARPIESSYPKNRPLHVAGAQMEFPSQLNVISTLDRLAAEYPDTGLFVLSEYTFAGPVPDNVKAWCRTHQKYLVAGGKDFTTAELYYNTAFVIGPDGGVVFKQAKSVPIQLFNDGLPAPGQKVWDSPWGKIGICICYDLSYRRVTDRLVELGAQALIVPTMDIKEWGLHEHELHERVAKIRASEYGLPIFRVASSGISQIVDYKGREKTTAPASGMGASISGRLKILERPAHIPLDRFLAPFSVVVTACFIAWLALSAILRSYSTQPQPTAAPR